MTEPHEFASGGVVADLGVPAVNPEARYAKGLVVRPAELGSLPREEQRVPSGIIRFSRPLTDDEYQRLERAWRENYGNANGPHRVRVLVDDGPSSRPVSWWKRAYFRVRGWLA
jgi:hypothetical protein